MDQFNEILNYVVQVGPSIVSVLGMVLSVVISIARQGYLNKTQIAAIDSLANDLRQENTEILEDNRRTRALVRAVIKENAELKAQIAAYNKANSPIAEVKHE